jgi:hypothetical protein
VTVEQKLDLIQNTNSTWLPQQNKEPSFPDGINKKETKALGGALLLQEAMLTHQVPARPKRVVARGFRVGLMRKLGLSCSGERHGTVSRTAREQKAKNVASTMGFGCGR